LVDDQYVLAVLDSAIREAAEDQPIVIIGCPRTVKQAELIASLLAFHIRKKNVLALTLSINLEEATRRALEGDRERMARVDSTPERVGASHRGFLESNTLICAELSAYNIECIALDANGSKTVVEAALYALVDERTPLSQINTH
jgi:adenylate kinase family enzyme